MEERKGGRYKDMKRYKKESVEKRGGRTYAKEG